MRATLFACVIGLGTLAGCSVPYEVDPNFGADSTIDTGVSETDSIVAETPSETGGCTGNLDCAGRLDTPLCNVVLGQCVACLTNDRCAKGTYCSKSGECLTGCREDSECSTPPKGDAGVDGGDAGDASVTVLKCDPETHMCRGCKIDNECPAGFLCSASESLCKPGCNAAHACAAGNECCDDKCVDLTTSSANCGGCGKACVAPPHSVMKCEASTCKVASCDTGWADCAAGDDGCETDIFTKTDSCGGCGTVCMFANGVGTCELGKCKVTTCNVGFGDCDKNGANGCEQSLNTNDHCTACDTKCAPANATGTCGSGACLLTGCNAGFGDCDMTPGNGCETNLNTNAANCTTCGNICPSTLGTPACVGGACRFSTCTAGLGDCDGTGACSTPITNSVSNCGACGRTCSVANGTPACSGSTCSVSGCNSGFADCNASYIDGCERSTRTVTDCGGCGVPCTRPNATATCSTGVCATGACAANFGDCDSIDSNGCETPTTSDPLNCGGCGKSCAVANGSGGTCAGAACTYRCNAGFVNCDGTLPDANGCERSFAASANTCASPTTITDAGGGTFLGCRTTETGSATTTTARWFKITLTSACGGAGCKSSDPLRARIALTNPAGVDYDLFVYKACGGGAVGSSTTTAMGGTETVTYSDAACPATQDLLIEVRYKDANAAASCASATVTVTSAF